MAALIEAALTQLLTSRHALVYYGRETGTEAAHRRCVVRLSGRRCIVLARLDCRLPLRSRFHPRNRTVTLCLSSNSGPVILRHNTEYGVLEEDGRKNS